MKHYYLLTLAAALAFAGCKKDNLTVEQTDYTLGAFEERTATAAFTATSDWTLSIVYDETETETGDETDADAAWLTADAAGGAAGEQSVQLTARLNFQTSPRTAYVDLACGEQSVRLTVTQTAASGDTDFSALFDPTFAQKLQELGHISNAENITLEEMKSMAVMTILDVSGISSNPGALTSLQGIEYFESLTTLLCFNNQLTSLDVSKNTALTGLYCSDNQLTTLDVSGCTALTMLDCYDNQLTSLDISKNTVLTMLFCTDNQLTTLDISQNTALMQLLCYNNQLTSLDVSKNTALTILYCYNNPGDGVSKFPVTAWFDNATVPGSLRVPKSSWEYNDNTITIDFQKAPLS